VWVPNGRLSSAAFHEPKFSVNIASIEDHAATLQRFGADCGLAEFLCGDALALGYAVYHEPENNNPAHAHVYADFGANERKRKARSLADRARLVKMPVASP
jgi:hypothetical protein